MMKLWIRTSENRILRVHQTGTFGIKDRLRDQQRGLCAVCHKPLPDNAQLDHDHETGHIRGLVHPSCNRDLIVVDSGNLQNVLDYLAQEKNLVLTVEKMTKRQYRSTGAWLD